MYEKMFQELVDLILTSNPMESDVRALYASMQPHIRVLAESLHVARIDVRIEIDPNIYEINGQVDTFTNFYHEEVAPRSEALVLTYPKLSNTTGTSVIYPWKDHTWTAAERQEITAVSKLLDIQLSRCNMIRRHARAPFIDMLTGLANNAGVNRFGNYISNVASMADYAGCFINLKNFKYINQHLSQPGGDQAMRQYAFKLYGFLDPRRELIARLGGDNFFALVLKSHMGEFLAMASALNVTIDQGERKDVMPLSAWIGVYPAQDGDTIPDVLNRASFAYERAKRSRVSISYFDPSGMEQSLRAKKVAQAFPAALRKGEFIPFYQPKVRMSTGKLYGCEALVRWIKDDRQIPPSEFVSVAEQSGLITQLDQYMLERVCQDLRRWLDDGIEPVPVSINYSQQDFYSKSLVQDTLNIIHKYNIDGKYIEIEITESSFHENFSALEDFIKAMHENGIRVSLDDFGTGYSSLTMFKDLDLDTIKLDKSFFDNLEDQEDTDRVVLRSIAEMINQLNKTSVSEGVETEEQLDFAKEIGCDIIQGYYFDRPLDYKEFTNRLLVRHYSPNGHPDQLPGA